jgi:hypothetical protein
MKNNKKESQNKKKIKKIIIALSGLSTTDLNKGA